MSSHIFYPIVDKVRVISRSFLSPYPTIYPPICLFYDAFRYEQQSERLKQELLEVQGGQAEKDARQRIAYAEEKVRKERDKGGDGGRWVEEKVREERGRGRRRKERER